MGVMAGAAFFMLMQSANILMALPVKRRTT
jgi:hypothetical protein